MEIKDIINKTTEQINIILNVANSTKVIQINYNNELTTVLITNIYDYNHIPLNHINNKRIFWYIYAHNQYGNPIYDYYEIPINDDLTLLQTYKDAFNNRQIQLKNIKKDLLNFILM